MPDECLQPSRRGAKPRIRAARRCDLNALLDLEQRAFATDRLSRRSFAALMASPSATLLVAEAGEKLAGYVLMLTRRGSRTARLYSIAVAPELARRGMGSRLLGAAELAAARRGATRLSLEVRETNAAARRLYEQRGYAPAGRRAAYYEDGATALRYRRELPRHADAKPALGRAA